MRGSISIFFYQVKQYHLYRQKKKHENYPSKKIDKNKYKIKKYHFIQFPQRRYKKLLKAQKQT